MKIGKFNKYMLWFAKRARNLEHNFALLFEIMRYKCNVVVCVLFDLIIIFGEINFFFNFNKFIRVATKT